MDAPFESMNKGLRTLGDKISPSRSGMIQTVLAWCIVGLVLYVIYDRYTIQTELDTYKKKNEAAETYNDDNVLTNVSRPYVKYDPRVIPQNV